MYESVNLIPKKKKKKKSLRGSHSQLYGSHKIHTAGDDQQLVSALNREIQLGDWAGGVRSTYRIVADLPLTPLASYPSDLLFLGVRDSLFPNLGVKAGETPHPLRK